MRMMKENGEDVEDRPLVLPQNQTLSVIYNLLYPLTVPLATPLNKTVPKPDSLPTMQLRYRLIPKKQPLPEEPAALDVP